MNRQCAYFRSIDVPIMHFFSQIFSLFPQFFIEIEYSNTYLKYLNKAIKYGKTHLFNLFNTFQSFYFNGREEGIYGGKQLQLRFLKSKRKRGVIDLRTQHHHISHK